MRVPMVVEVRLGRWEEVGVLLEDRDGGPSS